MKMLPLLVLLFIVTGCDNSSNKINATNTADSKRWTVSLMRVKTDLAITLPVTYDTLLIWKETSCQSNANKYRIQNKNVPIYFDGGCADTSVPYNKLQLTIREPLNSFDKNIIINNETIVRDHRQQVMYSQNDPQTQQNQFDTILYHNDKIFSIFSNIFHDTRHNVFGQTFETTIYLKGLPITILVERSYPKIPLDRTIFINECISIIKSLTASNRK